MSSTLPSNPSISKRGRVAVLVASFLGLVFDGFELGLMPVASPAVTRSFYGEAFTNALDGKWFAEYTAALMLGAAIGGIILGNLGDRIGRARAMGVSILFYSLFAGGGAFVHTPEQMLALRFLVGLGVGGMWPNGVALVAECWPNTSRPTVAGILGSGINVGVLSLSILGQIHPITHESWRWVFGISAFPAILGIIVITSLPESPQWLASRGQSKKPAPPVSELFRGRLLRLTLIGILLASIPLIGAWAGSKWMIPWAANVGFDANRPDYKSTTQFCWALGATFGGLLGAPFAGFVGRRLSYFLISIGATAATWSMFRLTAPFEPSFLPIVMAQGFLATLFFGWLPLYLPELFPVRVRATGAGVAMNVGRFVTAAGVLLGRELFTWFGDSYSAVGAAFATVFALGIILAFLIPDADDGANINTPITADNRLAHGRN
jgi:predicted MFS family arabinose efflux permease